MPLPCPADLVALLSRCHLLEPVPQAELSDLQARFPESRSLLRELVQRGRLTPYQANLLAQGRGHELLLGAYVLLEKLGEGGMGQVFKARHQKLGRIVALKVIRKQRLDNPAAVRRFQREIRAAAQLDHPNVVHAYDAEEDAGCHFLVLEYIEGIDLAKLVKQQGPVPVVQACDYIRQAALALQHAFERGLVHRDIKPSNLLLAKDGTVKVLDMGLARLASATDEESTALTEAGMVMGTADYLAPEQALESHTVDIRADLYSLGCTFFFLLTGRVPFPTGTFLQKANKHQFEEAPAVEGLRPEVPPAVAAVVRKLMAKRPEDRYQTPAEVAAILTTLLNTGNGLALSASATEQMAVQRGVAGAGTQSPPFADLEPSATAVALEAEQRQRQQAAERRLLLYSAVGGGVVLVGLMLLLVLLWRPSSRTTPTVPGITPPAGTPTPPAPLTEKVDEAWINQVRALPADRQVEAVRDKLQKLNRNFDGKVERTIDNNGVVTELSFLTDNVTDISPVRALPGLKKLVCKGSTYSSSKVADLAPLKGMSLEYLDCTGARVRDLSPLHGMPLRDLILMATQVSDLSPLKGMPLKALHVQRTPVSDLSPLTGMPMTWLSCDGTSVADLSPLKDMPLHGLQCEGTPVTDLSPLQGMPLQRLWCRWTRVTDFAPLKGLPLKELRGDFQPERDAEVLHSLETLELINEKPAAEFWKDVEAQQKRGKVITNSLGMQLALIPEGTFLMGSPPNEPGREANEEQHEVTITRPFYLGVHEVTVGQFRAFVKATGYQTDAEKGGGADRPFPDGWKTDPLTNWQNPGFEQADDSPVVAVTWKDAVAFCDWLSAKEGKHYSLPTEAQWEYACRAGSRTKFCFGEEEQQLDWYAWYDKNSGMKTHPVGGKRANAWGLCDVHGNAWEWCQDWYGPYSGGDVRDPKGPDKGARRVIRGGSVVYGARRCRDAARASHVPGLGSVDGGFRVLVAVD